MSPRTLIRRRPPGLLTDRPDAVLATPQGPGLAIRCPGEITEEKLDILRKADAVYIDAIRKAGLYDTIWQAFAVLLPVKTVGVMGDGRTYDYVVGLRAVTSTTITQKPSTRPSAAMSGR